MKNRSWVLDINMEFNLPLAAKWESPLTAIPIRVIQLFQYRPQFGARDGESSPQARRARLGKYIKILANNNKT